MASKIRVEFIRLRQRDSNGIHNALAISDAAPVTKAVDGTALTGAGRIECPERVNGFTTFHARIQSDVECIVSFAPKGDETTDYDASAAVAGAVWIPEDTPVLVEVSDGMLLSAATGLAFA